MKHFIDTKSGLIYAEGYRPLGELASEKALEREFARAQAARREKAAARQRQLVERSLERLGV